MMVLYYQANNRQPKNRIDGHAPDSNRDAEKGNTMKKSLHNLSFSSSALTALILVLCLLATCCCAEAQETSTPFSIEAMLAANSQESVLSRHKSIAGKVERPFAGDFSFYCDGEAFFDAEAEQTIMIGNGEVWYDLNPGGEEKAPAIICYAMPDAERDALLAENTIPTLDIIATLKEEVQSVTDHKDGTMTVITRLSGDQLAAKIERNQETFPEEYLGNPAETVYTLSAGTLEVLSVVDSVIVGNEKIIYSNETIEYDVSRPEYFDRILALRDEFSVAEEGHMRTLTVIYDAGTEAEETYTISVNENLLFSPYLKDGYTEERREVTEGNGAGDVTIWAVIAAPGT